MAVEDNLFFIAVLGMTVVLYRLDVALGSIYHQVCSFVQVGCRILGNLTVI